MGLRTAAETVQSTRRGPSCTFGDLLATLDADDLAFYQQMVDEGRLRTYIGDVFRADGHTISDSTIRRHLARRCLCP